MPSVFYSWQSDRPTRENRSLIRDALQLAITEMNADIDEAARPDDRLELDHDTKGLPGSPDIVAAILAKIEVAGVFVADVTPIAISEGADGRSPRQIANPNVLIELGYAKRAIGPDKIVQVWNTCFTDCLPDDLPFDMRGRRGPISYRLETGASKQERQKALSNLSKALNEAVSLILSNAQSETVTDRWHERDENDPSIWPTKSGVMVINEPDHGSGTKQIFPPPRSYVRILPHSWTGSDTADRHDLLLGNWGGFSWGATRGGTVTYPGTIGLPQLGKVHSVTKRFPKTGELWATRTSICGKHDETLYLYGDDVVGEWASFLGSAVPHVLVGGGSLPLIIRVGVAGLGELHWPSDTRFGAPPVALDDNFEYEFILTAGDKNEMYAALLEASNRIRSVFSEPELSQSQEKALMFRLHQ